VTRTRLSSDLVDVEGFIVELTRDQVRLAEIRSKIVALSVVSTDVFNLPTRYQSLVSLEAILVRRVSDTARPGRAVSNGRRVR
jgi:hypothetical protein